MVFALISLSIVLIVLSFLIMFTYLFFDFEHISTYFQTAVNLELASLLIVLLAIVIKTAIS